MTKRVKMFYATYYMNKYLIQRDSFYKPLCPKTTHKLVFIHKRLFLK